jgi:tetratricopeptide (TPR) repeat protein
VAHESEPSIKKEAAVSPQLPEFDSLWNYDDPAGTEAKFRELLPKAQAAGDSGLPGGTADADCTYTGTSAEIYRRKCDPRSGRCFDSDRPSGSGNADCASASLLERGRVLNSSKKSEESIRYFEDALKFAENAGLEFYAVDAAHMLGIAAKGEESLRWNEEAIRMSEAARDPRARRWLGPLYNNTGWTYFDMRRYDDALKMFPKGSCLSHSLRNKVEIGIARWSAAKVLRYTGTRR